MYYDVLIQDSRSVFPKYYVLSKVKTLSMVKSFCKKEIKSVFCIVYVRKVEKEITTKWKIILNTSQYFSNMKTQPLEVCTTLSYIFNKELKNAK